MISQNEQSVSWQKKNVLHFNIRVQKSEILVDAIFVNVVDISNLYYIVI